MSAIAIFAYPRTQDVEFDHDYYSTSHMPMVARTWAKYGMQSWECVRMADDAPNIVECIVYWESLEGFSKAIQEESEDILADVKNYTNVAPVITKGVIKGKGSV
ncbi:hypothetical protein CDD81_4180 [Ophiocordyceps australis]|uniref:EthD domain-containing protein n=1 Tax=Ophiocordyceps australis TaxID=1399860 RepID=A0A2C5X718_9HYPO|nr:hypothetical protein CDD81_4180 [Ophiocordyceps australis]